MALESELFRGDPKLEAALVSDPGHIMPGARGPWVSKIQQALNRLDNAGLAEDGSYGPKTAKAVQSFKQKRNIINRSYQQTADEVVGRMTMAALDKEMVAFERELAKRPRIIAVHPRQDPDYNRPREVQSPPFLATISARGAKELVTRPQILPPGPNPFQEMELRVGEFGNFTVVDGKGGTVSSWNSEKARIVTSDNAHDGPVKIDFERQTFVVQAKHEGRTSIEARKPGQTFPVGDLLTVVVQPPKEQSVWNPKWTVTMGQRLDCNPWAVQPFGDGRKVPGVLLKSPLIEFKGSVLPGPSINRAEFELGILQNVMTSNLVAHYADAAGVLNQSMTISCPRARDTADKSPLWYAASAAKQLSAGGETAVETNDSPQMPVPWQTSDKTGNLVATRGQDTYMTWLVVRRKSNSELIRVAWVRWDVDWGATFEFKTERRAVTGSGSKNGEGVDEAGLIEPVVTGRTALEQTTVVWGGPGGL